MQLPSPKAVSANLRTILLKVSPAPSSLAERRAILHLLKKYADVEFFKRLNDPSHFISIVGNPEIAHRLVEQSPFVFDYTPQQQSRKNTTTTTSRSLSVAVNDSPTTNPSTTAEENTQPVRTFLVKMTDKQDYAHRTRIRSSVLYGRWPAHDDGLVFREDSVARAALRRAVPAGPDADGLADWESFGQADDDDTAGVLPLRDPRDFVQARRQRQADGATGFESLVELWNKKYVEEKGRIGGGGGSGVEAGGRSVPGEGKGGSKVRERSGVQEVD
ncbi:hypothetical protein N658DRAFT_466431 [Parathielavia hyrcaniae]|uniref:Uncharacterized protein n=1 Tax=Parathielavia hyrcaniae TaxID=113614 RepID=A0AAN6Q8U6_9PEZI|nr:hypothetical protein N658DRAFT_466431 [Parathielavia hyrcaniae]